MTYLKCVLSGVAGAVVAIVVLLAALTGFVYWRLEPPPQDGAVAIIVTPYQVLLAAAIGFGIGFWWNARRQRRRVRG